MRPVVQTASSVVGGSTQPCVLDYHLGTANTLIAVELGGNTGGGASYTVQYSPDDPYATYVTSYSANANWYNHPSLVNLSADGVGNLGTPARAIKLVTNTPGTGGTQTPQMVTIQAGGIS